jgi:hypothetical protein
MSIPSNITTSSAALEFIKSHPNLSVAELSQLVAQMPVTIPQAQTTLLYSGGLETNGSGGTVMEGLQTWQVAEHIGQSSQGAVATLGQTEAGKLLEDVRFTDALEVAAF